MSDDRLPDRQAFDAWVGPHLDCMFRAARRVLRSDDLAWDAVQSVLLRFWRDPRRPDDPRSALVSVVTRASLGELRRSRRRHRHEAVAQSLRASRDHAHCDDPACRLEQEELASRLHDAIDGLPDECRDVLRLRESEELDYVAIARRLGVPVGTVRSRLARARRLMSERLLRDGTVSDESPRAARSVTARCLASTPRPEPVPVRA